MRHEERTKLINTVLGNPNLFPTVFKQWVPSYVAPELGVTNSQFLTALFQEYNMELLATTTNPNIGDQGYTYGQFIRFGTMLLVRGRVKFDGSGISAGSGDYEVTVPLPQSEQRVEIRGVWDYLDSSTGNYAFGITGQGSISTSTMRFTYPATWLGLQTTVKNNAPWTPAADDILQFSAWYETM